MTENSDSSASIIDVSNPSSPMFKGIKKCRRFFYPYGIFEGGGWNGPGYTYKDQTDVYCQDTECIGWNRYYIKSLKYKNDSLITKDIISTYDNFNGDHPLSVAYKLSDSVIICGSGTLITANFKTSSTLSTASGPIVSDALGFSSYSFRFLKEICFTTKVPDNILHDTVTSIYNLSLKLVDKKYAPLNQLPPNQYLFDMQKKRLYLFRANEIIIYSYEKLILSC